MKLLLNSCLLLATIFLMSCIQNSKIEENNLQTRDVANSQDGTYLVKCMDSQGTRIFSDLLVTSDEKTVKDNNSIAIS